MIEFIDIHKSFGSKQVLRGVSIGVDAPTIEFFGGASAINTLSPRVLSTGPDVYEGVVDHNDYDSFVLSAACW